MPAPSTCKWNDSLKFPSYIHTSQTVIYAPQYFVDHGIPAAPYAPTVVTFPPMPTGQTSFATYVCYSTTTATVSNAPNPASQCAMPSQAQNLADGSLECPRPLNNYRFPSPLPIPEQRNKIYEIIEEEEPDTVSVSDATGCSTGRISGMDLPTVCGPEVRDNASSASSRLVQHPVEPAVVQSQRISKVGKSTRAIRGNKLPVTPQSVLLTRRVSSCIQPYRPKEPLPSESTKRAKRSKAKHYCKLCDQSFTRAHDLKRHNTTHESYKAHPCPYCSKAFGRKDALTRHIAVRGTNHNDFTKKAAPKKKTGLDGVPKVLRNMTPIPEESLGAIEMVTEELDTVVNTVRDNVPEFAQEIDDTAASCFSSSESDFATESSSRASSVYMSVPASLTSSRSSDCDEGMLIPQPFNIDRKSSLVQGLPSAHLHLDDANLLHPFIDPFTPTCGI